MLLRATKSIELEVNSPATPEGSRLDDWYLGSGNDSQPRSTPVPFFLEIHEELAKTWKALYTTQSCLRSSLLITLNSGVAKGYISIP